MSNRQVRKAKKDINAERAAELQRLYVQHGELRSSTVVEAARDKRSPLHDYFEWDDHKAGHEYRLQQARKLMRLHVIVTQPEGAAERLIHVPPSPEQSKDDGEGAYHPVSVVVENIDWFARAIGELESKLRAAMQAAEELRNAAEASGRADQMRMAQIMVAMTAIRTASDVVKSLH